MNAQSKTTVVPKLSYLHVSKLKKRNRNHKKLFNFWHLVLLKGSTFHLNDKKISDIGTLIAVSAVRCAAASTTGKRVLKFQSNSTLTSYKEVIKWYLLKVQWGFTLILFDGTCSLCTEWKDLATKTTRATSINLCLLFPEQIC